MKLISLNVWCGIKHKKLIDFLKNQAKGVDIFCFQEVRNGHYIKQKEPSNERSKLFKEIQKTLIDFNGYFTPMTIGVGLAIFLRNNLRVRKIKKTVILRKKDIIHLKNPEGKNYYPRILQSVWLKEYDFVVHNFHGIPGDFKRDNPERNLQTKKLMELINNKQSHILVGDFNLDINTKSIKKISKKMLNLIETEKIKTTRNKNYNKHKELPFADYVFISKNIKKNNFKVLPDNVSDHLPLLLDFCFK